MFGRLSPFVDAVPDGLLQAEESVLVGATTGYRGGRRAPERPSTQDESGYYDPGPDLDLSIDQDLPRFVKGERVLHDTFGSGTIGEVSGFGRDLRVTVHFETVGSKRLLVRYAGLRRDYE